MVSCDLGVVVEIRGLFVGEETWSLVVVVVVGLVVLSGFNDFGSFVQDEIVVECCGCMLEVMVVKMVVVVMMVCGGFSG